jgi:hypothetical protein
MNQEPNQFEPTSRQQLGILLKPKNLLRTLASAAPGASALLEMQSQLEGVRLDERITSLEDTDLSLQAKLHELEKAQPKFKPHESNWPAAATDYLRRIVDIVIVYDGAVDSPSRPGCELFLSVAHGCFVGPDAVLTCTEALELALEVANYKKGALAIIAGFGWYEIEVEPVDTLSGLVILKIVRRDEERYARLATKMKKAGLPESMFAEPLRSSIISSVYPGIGQDIGFIHTGEADDVWRDGISKFQMDKTTISHFREIREDAIKTFITGVLPGRILKAGSPIFGGDGTLFGVIATTTHYPSDAGRRAVVRSLLGHPRFTVLPKSSEDSSRR